jgi:hypothetical protein
MLQNVALEALQEVRTVRTVRTVQVEVHREEGKGEGEGEGEEDILIIDEEKDDLEQEIQVIQPPRRRRTVTMASKMAPKKAKPGKGKDNRYPHRIVFCCDTTVEQRFYVSPYLSFSILRNVT